MGLCVGVEVDCNEAVRVVVVVAAVICNIKHYCNIIIANSVTK